MKRQLSLHHLTALDASAAELVDIAADLGCDSVCLFTHLAANYTGRFPCIVTAREVSEVRSRLRERSVSVCNLEVFSISPAAPLEDMWAGLERGAQLGAGRATAHIRETDESVAIERFAAFCAMAAQFEMIVGLEFTGFSAVRTMEAAARIVTGSGARNAGIAVDVLHLYRNGGSMPAVARHAAAISYAQLCDGKRHPPAEDYYPEAVENREIPGRGEFPLQEFVSLLPHGAPVSVEVPMHRLRDAGVPARERARLAVEGARRFVG